MLVQRSRFFIFLTPPMICPKCGEYVYAEFDDCPECGYKLK